MRWDKKYPIHIKIGSFRTIKKFLWVPKELSGIYRWLEVATIYQRFEDDWSGKAWWQDIKWLDI